HDIFIPYYVANDVNDLFICLTTRQLLSVCKYSSVLAIDCTYKITTNELPLLVIETSDYNRRFYPMSICLISTDESADTFHTLFRGIQQWASVVNSHAYTISLVLADGAPVEQDIFSMQLIFDDKIFAIASCLMLSKWSADAELNDFRQYFEQEWILSLPYWYEEAACLAPSTNNGLESLNDRIKKDYTLRNRLPLSAFLKTAERMLIDWSKDIPSKNGNMCATTWTQQFHAMVWNNYDELVNWLNSAHLISCLRLLIQLYFLLDYFLFFWQAVLL
ncbi:unnamed protein product, partial [Rotaria sp. Silwood1]